MKKLFEVRFTPILSLLYLLNSFFLCFARPAYAYLDPGTGSVLLQALAFGFLGVGIFWRKIKNFFRSLFGGPKDKTPHA